MQVYATGYNAAGSLGIENHFQSAIFSPAPIDLSMVLTSEESESLENITLQPCDYSFGLHTILKMINEQQQVTLIGTGFNDFGQLSLQDTLNRKKFVKLKLPDALAKQTIEKIVCGANHTIISTSSNHLYACGTNANGELGNGVFLAKPHPQFSLIQQWNPKSNIIKLVCGANHNFCLLENGQLYGWGRNVEGQLGMDHFNNINVPTLIRFSENHPIKDVFCGTKHSIIITKQNEVYSCGDNTFGQLGLGDRTNRKVFEKITTFGEMSPVTHVAANNDQTYFYIQQNHQLLVSGSNENNDFLLGHSNALVKPTSISTNLQTKFHVQKMSCNYGQNLYLLSDSGECYVRGANTKGELGLGHKDKVTEFIKLDGSHFSPHGYMLTNVLSTCFSTFFFLQASIINQVESLHQAIETDLWTSFSSTFTRKIQLQEKQLTLFDEWIQKRFPELDIDSIANEQVAYTILYYIHKDILPPYLEDVETNSAEMLTCILETLRFCVLRDNTPSRLKNLLVHCMMKKIDIDSLTLILQYLNRLNIRDSLDETNELSQILRQSLRFYRKLDLDEQLETIVNGNEIPVEYIKLASQQVKKAEIREEVQIADVSPSSLYKDWISLRPWINQEETGDVELIIQVKDVKETIRAHKVVLSLRCPFLKKQLEANPNTTELILSDEKQDVHERTNSSTLINSYKQFIDYLYTGKLSITEENALYLMQCFSSKQMNASMNHANAAILKECEAIILKQINLENVLFFIQVILARYEDYLPNLKKHAFSYAAKHWEILLDKYKTTIQQFLTYEQYHLITMEKLKVI